MTSSHLPEFIAFEGSRCLVRGPLTEVALQVKAATEARPLARFMVFHAHSSELIDFDLRGSNQEVLARLASTPFAQTTHWDAAQALDEAEASPVNPAPAGPGRPKLGVVAREVTLLPRHWAWLSSQPGGASVALRQLVEHARRASATRDARRLSQESAYRFMSAMAGSLEGFEEAARALFAAERQRFDALLASWPADIQAHLQQLAQAAMTPLEPQTELEPSHA